MRLYDEPDCEKDEEERDPTADSSERGERGGGAVDSGLKLRDCELLLFTRQPGLERLSFGHCAGQHELQPVPHRFQPEAADEQEEHDEQQQAYNGEKNFYHSNSPLFCRDYHRFHLFCCFYFIRIFRAIQEKMGGAQRWRHAEEVCHVRKAGGAQRRSAA